jgi:hypothetical protein
LRWCAVCVVAGLNPIDRFSVETCGGMAHDAIKLLSAMGRMGDEQLGMWPRHVVIRHLVGSVATSVQRGNAVAWLSGYSRALAAMGERRSSGEAWEEQERVVGNDSQAERTAD